LGSEIKESLINLDGEDGGLLDDLGEELMDSLLLEGESDGKKDKKQSSKVSCFSYLFGL
jgi:hypothetical protein